MHNKFCVADGKRVFTGSFNPTYKGNNETFNNVVVIESAPIAANYVDEFSELWNGEFGRGANVRFPAVNVSGVLVENYFCPEDSCADHLKDEIRNANTSVYFMVFSFTDNSVANELIIKKQEGVDVRGVFDSGQAGSEASVFELLKYQGVDVKKEKSPFVLHHKVFIIDGKITITGSYNPTLAGNTKNDENMLVIHDQGIGQQFIQEFLEMESKT
jgi:phosphatidylserine/phosphatidylglycerophosphate/cardiolipin synthase-like enzyme